LAELCAGLIGTGFVGIGTRLRDLEVAGVAQVVAPFRGILRGTAMRSAVTWPAAGRWPGLGGGQDWLGLDGEDRED